MTAIVLATRMPQRDDARGRQRERRRREVELMGEAHQEPARQGADAIAVREGGGGQRVALNRNGDPPCAAERGERVVDQA